MRRLPGGAGLLLGVVLLTALLAEGRGLPLRKQRGPRPRSHAKLAEVSGGRGAARARPPSGRPLWPCGDPGWDASSGPWVRGQGPAWARCTGPQEPPLLVPA